MEIPLLCFDLFSKIIKIFQKQKCLLWFMFDLRLITEVGVKLQT